MLYIINSLETLFQNDGQILVKLKIASEALKQNDFDKSSNLVQVIFFLIKNKSI